MFRNKLLIIFCTLLLAFFSVFVFVKIQQRDTVNRLNNNDLSNSAYLIKLKSSVSLQNINEKLSKEEKLDNFQLQYQDKKNKNMIFFYGKGNFSSPAMKSGSFFTDNDFNSLVSTVIVGKDIAKNLYIPQSQGYLHYNNQYYPVLGVMGTKQKSGLDNKIFISPSVDILKNKQSRDYNIIFDSDKPVDIERIKKILNATSVTSIFKNNLGIPKGVWFQSLLKKGIALLAIIVSYLILATMWAKTKETKYYQFIDGGILRIVFFDWQVYTILSALGTLLGVVLGLLYFTILDYRGLITFNIATVIISSIVCFVILYARLNKLRKENIK